MLPKSQWVGESGASNYFPSNQETANTVERQIPFTIQSLNDTCHGHASPTSSLYLQQQVQLVAPSALRQSIIPSPDRDYG